MSGIRGTMCFPSKIKIYMPTCRDRCLREVRELVEDVNKIFGASTIYDKATGTWTSMKTGETVTEPVKVIELAHHCTNPVQARALGKAIIKYSVRARQESIAISGGSFYMAEQPQLMERFVRRNNR